MDRALARNWPSWEWGGAMICVTIGRGRHGSLLDEWKAAAQGGAELVELRLDCLRRDVDLKRVLAERPTPMVITVRRAVDGGLWRGDEEKRQRLLREAIALGVDYVDLEMDVAKQIRKFGRTKRIISYHNLKTTPEGLVDIAEQCDEMDADVVKVATLAKSLSDAVNVLHVAQRAVVPTVAIAMGEVGFFTRVLGAKLKAPFTYANFNPDRVFAPGMPSFHALKKDYYYDEIDDQTEVYAVIGDPIGQSLSPAIHNASFRHLGLNKVLVPILVPAGRLGGSLDELEWLGIKGYSVTIPHKEEMVTLLRQKEDTVERTGSCNTMVVEDGMRAGYNTDYRAALDTLEDALGGRPQDGEASPLLDKQALILGAGGVARSLAFGLMHRGAGVSLASRSDEKATKLASDVGCRAIHWGNRASTQSDILVNCTPVGMFPKVDDTPAPPAAFRPGMLVFDTVYHPEHTMFLKLATERGCTTVTGVDMFVHQAAKQFQIYTGLEAPMQLMRDVMKGKLSSVRET